MWRVGVLAIGIALVPGAIEAAWAQAAEGLGQVNAVSYREVPDRLMLSITLFDDSDLDLQIRDQMIAALEKAKHSLTQQSPFELELSSETHSGRVDQADPSLGQLSSNSDDTQFEMNIWSSSQDSILGGRQSGGARRTAGTFEIRATLRERSLGEVVWEGHAMVEAERDQVGPYIAPMVQSLVKSLGQTVRHGTFAVP